MPLNDALSEDHRAKFLARMKLVESGCIEWTSTKIDAGYGVIKVSGKMLRAHRIAYEMFVGPIIDGLWVLHNCDNRACVNPEHLRLGTAADNAQDAVDRGRLASGDRNGSRLHPERRPKGPTHYTQLRPEIVRNGEQIKGSKLREVDIPIIRQRHASGETYTAIARDYGTTIRTISLVVTRRGWRHVP